MQLKEEAVFTLKFDGKPVVNELGELEKKLNDVKEAQKTVERGTQEWADNKAAIKELEASIKAVREEMGVSGMTVQQLQGYYRQLNAEILKLTPGTEAYQKKAADLQEVNTALANHRANVRAVSDEVEKQPSLWERAKSTAVGYLAAFSATELLERAISFVQDGIKKALELSDMMAGVAKSTGQSTEEVKELAQELDKIDTRSSKESLMDIAQIGGQLGVANQELLGFVKSVDMANVALGDEFVGGAEEVSSKLGGLQKLFKETKDLQAGEAINQIGSAINELGAAGSATGPVVADFTARIGQLGDLSPEISQTMGLGAAFQELGLSAEISAGGLSNILLTAAKDTATFAQQLNMSEDAFKQLINTNPNEFLLRLAESLKNVPADQLAKRLDEMGIKSQEATKVMSLLKDQTDMVRQKQELASKAMAEGTSLQKEFNTVNSNAAAEYAKSQKAIDLIATEIGQGLLPAITKGAQGVVAFVNIIRAIPEFVSENRTSFAALGLAVLAFNGHLIVATATSIGHAAAEKARLVWTNSATAAQWLLNTAMTANPIGVVVAAIALLVAGLVAIYTNSSTVRGIISGLWEVMKTGVGLIGDLTEKVVGWIQKGLDPLRPALELTGRILSSLWSIFTAGIGYLVSVQQAINGFISNGLDRISSGLAPVRSALTSLWSLIDTGITKIKAIGSAITSFLHVDDLVAKIKQTAGQIGDAFNKGYGDKLAEGAPKQLATHQQTLNTKKAAEQKTANELVDIVTSSDQKAIDKKAAQNEKHRVSEAKKAADAAKKESDEAVKASSDGLKKIEDLRIASIKDDLERSIASIRSKRDSEVEAMTASKASASVKAVWETALNEQMIRDIAKAETDHRTKHEKEESETAKRILDLKVKLSGDEKADKLQKLQDIASAQTLQIQKDVSDETQKAAMLKQVNDNLIAGKEKVEQEYRRKNQAETKALMDAQYQATVADTDARLLMAQDNANKIYSAKKDRLDAEYQYNKQKLQREADEEKTKNQELIQDKDRRAQADKATDDKLKAQLTANDLKYENDKTTLTVEKTAARKKNQEEFFSAIKGLMQGDFTTFTDLLTKKMAGEKKQLTDSQKANVDKIDTVGGYAVMGIQALTALNTAALNKELGNINKEKTTQLAAWKDKYDKGLINKDQYEKGVDKINKDADTKTKQAQLEAFKRQQKLDIIMAVINGIQAALKSLAMFGWPFGLIGAAGAAVAAGVQIAAIKSQQPPSMAKGGTIKNAGVPEGPRHGSRYGDSGLSITRRDTGEEVAEMEGGEPVMVLSRNTYKNNRQVVDSLLHSSLHRNGAPVMRNGGIFFDDGGVYGYDNYEQNKYGSSGSGGTTASQDTPPTTDSSASGGSSWMDDANSAATDMDSSSYQAEVDKSTALMEAIGKNTLATADSIKLVVDALGLLQQQVARESTAQQSTLSTLLANLRADTQTGFTGLAADNAEQISALRLALHTDLVNLQGTMKIEFPSLGKDLLIELSAIQEIIALGLLALRQGINVDLMSLQRVTSTGFEKLTTSVHDDLLQLDTNVDANLDALTKNVHADLAQMQLAMALQQSLLRSETKLNFTTLQTILKAELQTLQQNTHTDLANADKSNVAELRTIQAILGGQRSEQGYQSTLLRIISEKNLSVSVQSIVSVWNQIDVVVDKSNFR